MTRPIRVFCVGPAPAVRGGISRLFGKIKDAFPNHIKFRIVVTYSEHIGDSQSDALKRLVQPLIFIVSVWQVLLNAVVHRSSLFHVHFSQRGSTLRKGLICVLLRALGCRYVVQAHACQDALFHEWVPVSVRRLMLWGIGGGHRVIALTRFWRDYYTEKLYLPKDKVVVLPNPAEVPVFIPDRAGRSKVRLLFLGRVGSRKGAFDLIHAFGTLPEAVRQNCHLTLAGDGETILAQELLDGFDCSAQASVLGWVSPQDVDRLLAESDVLVLPSHGEGMAIALLEGMAWGLAVVTSSAGGTDEFLETNNNCILVDPGDTQGIANAIADLERNPSLRQRLGAAARQTAMRFSMDAYIETLTRLYEELTAPDFRARGELPIPPNQS